MSYLQKPLNLHASIVRYLILFALFSDLHQLDLYCL